MWAANATFRSRWSERRGDTCGSKRQVSGVCGKWAVNVQIGEPIERSPRRALAGFIGLPITLCWHNGHNGSDLTGFVIELIGVISSFAEKHTRALFEPGSKRR